MWRLPTGKSSPYSQIPATEAVQTLDVRRTYVTPGLIDLHAHVFVNTYDMGQETDRICAATGVTTLIDGGSAGSATFPGLRRYVVEPCQTRIRCFVHVSVIGLIHLQVGELMNMAYADPEGCARTIRENRDIAIGVKLRYSHRIVGEEGHEALRLARQAADLAEAPLMVHVTNAPRPLPEILSYMRPGDIITHCLHRYRNGIMGPAQERILDEVWRAQQAGIIFDCAHGRMHFYFPLIRKAIAQGFLPDTIATDLTLPNALHGPAHNLPIVMSKFLNMGVLLEEIIKRTTMNPAHVIGEAGRLGTLKPGAIADVAAFMIERGSFEFQDTDGNTMHGDQRLVCRLTVKAGRIWWRANP